jgi:hypothetical protein
VRLREKTTATETVYREPEPLPASLLDAVLDRHESPNLFLILEAEDAPKQRKYHYVEGYKCSACGRRCDSPYDVCSGVKTRYRVYDN